MDTDHTAEPTSHQPSGTDLLGPLLRRAALDGLVERVRASLARPPLAALAGILLGAMALCFAQLDGVPERGRTPRWERVARGSSTTAVRSAVAPPGSIAGVPADAGEAKPVAATSPKPRTPAPPVRAQSVAEYEEARRRLF